MTLRLKFLNWLGSGYFKVVTPPEISKYEAVTLCDSSEPKAPPMGGALRNAGGSQTSISIIPALNGRVIEIGNYRQNMHGPDWTYEHYVVPEGEPLEAAMSAILLIKGVR
jgi:hypothetical protein